MEEWAPEQYAKWVIQQIGEEARLYGTPLLDEMVAVLELPTRAALDVLGAQVPAANNVVVNLIRSRIERDKQTPGIMLVQPRPGLRIPAEWHYAYSAIYQSELDWMIAAMMQNAFLNNRFAGERKPWRSR